MRSTPKPRVLIVGRTRYRLPLDDSLRRKFDALSAEMDVRVLGSAHEGSPTADGVFRLVPPLRPRRLDGWLFHALLPARVARELVRFRPDAAVVQGPHVAAGVLLARALVASPARVVLDVHGDWRTATRLYGSPRRRLLNPLADRIAAFAVRRADAVRTVSDFTTSLVRAEGREPDGTFPAFMDLEPFLERPPEPLPELPAALFVGVLERYKNVDGLAEAWRLAAPQVPGAQLRLVGTGSRTEAVEALLRDLPEQTRWSPRLATAEVARELDRATCLVLASPREGMGRVIVEALARGRPVVGTSAAGIRDLVHDGQNGVLVEPGDHEALAAAMARILGDRELAERLAAGARPSAEPWLATPEEYAARLRSVVEGAVSSR